MNSKIRLRRPLGATNESVACVPSGPRKSTSRIIFSPLATFLTETMFSDPMVSNTRPGATSNAAARTPSKVPANSDPSWVWSPGYHGPSATSAEVRSMTPKDFSSRLTMAEAYWHAGDAL